MGLFKIICWAFDIPDKIVLFAWFLNSHYFEKLHITDIKSIILMI